MSSLSLFWKVVKLSYLINLVWKTSSSGKKVACATVCHSKAIAEYVGSILGNKMFSMARSKEVNISGFPDFEGVLQDLKQYQRTPMPTYSVTVPTPEALVITEALVQFWTVKHSQFADDMMKLKDEHDKEFNPQGLKRGAEIEDPAEEERPSKRLCLSTSLTAAELESQHPERSDAANTKYFLCMFFVHIFWE